MSDVGAVGLYAMAVLIAFAPVEHFSSEVGKVLFAAAALTAAGHEVKLRDCLGRELDAKAVDEVLTLLGRLEALDARDVARIVELVS